MQEPGAHRLLVGDRPVLGFTTFLQERPTADDARALAPLDLVVPAVLDELAGMWFSSDDERLIDALMKAGATIVRHAHRLELDLSGEPVDVGSVPESLLVGPIDRSAAELAELSVRAYPAGHPDFSSPRPEAAAGELERLLSGSLIGPLMAGASGQVLDRRRLVAVCIINRSPNLSGPGGPWVSEVFRDPNASYRGLGTMLLRGAIASLSADGERLLGLAVTDGNPARAVYEKLGFHVVRSGRKLLIPTT